ncbi:MAG: hypothetical protein Q8891_01230 [Bacteroidota bacterium]|jgi:hypothetical protein|nr:hypothetical protein [Bacteroidota bacterium]
MKLILIFFLLIFTVTAFAQKATDNFSGSWKTAKGKIVVITSEGKNFVGKIEGTDMIILKGLAFDGSNWKGILQNPKENKSANCEAFLETGKLKLIARKGIMSKTFYWIKK